MELHRRYVLAALAASGAGLFAISASSTRSRPISFRIADIFPTSHLISQAITDTLIPRLESTGEIRVEYFPAGQLGAMGEYVDYARTGVIDIGYVGPGVGEVAGRFPTTNLLSLPGLFDNAVEATRVYLALAEGSLRPEYRRLGVRLLVGAGTGIYQFFTNRPVRRPEDVAGLKIRGGGGDADDFLRELGVAVVNISSAQMYEALQRGILDGTLYLASVAPSRHLEEVTRFATQGAPLMNLLVTYLIGEELYQSLPPHLQRLVTEAGRETSFAIARNYDRDNTSSRAFLEDAGMTFTDLDAADIAAWKAAYRNADQVFLRKLEGRGFANAREVYAEMRQLIAASSEARG